MIASGALALTGSSGVVVGGKQLRNIGIVGYVGVFLVVLPGPLDTRPSGVDPIQEH
jgi:hypothetical protein